MQDQPSQPSYIKVIEDIKEQYKEEDDEFRNQKEQGMGCIDFDFCGMLSNKICPPPEQSNKSKSQKSMSFSLFKSGEISRQSNMTDFKFEQDTIMIDENQENKKQIQQIQLTQQTQNIQQKQPVITKELLDKKVRLNQEIKNKGERRGTPWSKQELQILEREYKKHNGKNWKKIAEALPGRSDSQCSQRWRRYRPDKKRKQWDNEEDERLIKYVKQFGLSWSRVSAFFNNRTGKQVRERWKNKLDPEINWSPFKEEEDKQIISLYYKIGTKWSQIAKYLDHRPENMIKNRFYSHIRRNYDLESSSRSQSANSDYSSVYSTKTLSAKRSKSENLKKRKAKNFKNKPKSNKRLKSPQLSFNKTKSENMKFNNQEYENSNNEQDFLNSLGISDDDNGLLQLQQLDQQIFNNGNDPENKVTTTKAVNDNTIPEILVQKNKQLSNIIEEENTEHYFKNRLFNFDENQFDFEFLCNQNTQQGIFNNLEDDNIYQENSENKLFF